MMVQCITPAPLAAWPYTPVMVGEGISISHPPPAVMTGHPQQLVTLTSTIVPVSS